MAFRSMLGDHAHETRIVCALIATVFAWLVGTSGVASAADTLTVDIDPRVPGKGKPFAVHASGTRDLNGNTESLIVYFAPGLGSCADRVMEEEAKPDPVPFINAPLGDPGTDDEPFDRHVSIPGQVDSDYPGAFRSGLRAGHYHLCGYLYHQPANPPATTARLEFSVGGTCDTATSAVVVARAALKKARKRLEKAKDSGDENRIKKAKKAVKKAKKKLKAAEEDAAALCVS
jgi:hypothetical protein